MDGWIVEVSVHKDVTVASMIDENKDCTAIIVHSLLQRNNKPIPSNI